MERSRKRTPMIHRSKAVCAIALAVGFGCAVFGVGGAGAGDGAYVHHLQQVRLENLALAHRSPEQVVLAMTPNVSSPAATDTTTTPATTDPASTAAATTTSTTPPPTTTDASTTTTTATTTTPTTTDTTSTTDTSTTPTDTTTTGTTTTGTTTTGTTTNTSTTTTGTTKTATTTTPGTTTTATTTTPGTTTAGTTTTSGTTTTANLDASSSPSGHGRQPGTTGSGSTTSNCHGRCDGVTGSSGAVPASLPSSGSSTASSTSLSIGSVTTPSLASVPATPVNDASTGTISPVSSTTPASNPTPAPTSTSTTPSPSSTPLTSSLQSIVKSSSSAIRDLTHGNGSRNSAATLPNANGGTGGTTAGGTTGTGPAGAAAAGTAAAAAAAATTHASGHHSAKKHPSSGGSAFQPITTAGQEVIHDIVKVIPTAVWFALGAAFALMLAFAGLAFRSGRRARRREKEFAAISAAALTDALTGILNRRGFTEAAERELARASRYERPFVLAYVDVRGLKTVNDTEGHLMGDELIKTVAGLMKESARADDVVGRIGGDEFALLLGEQTAESAGPVVRRIKAHVAEARAAMEISVPWELTIGMASFPDDGATLEELLNVADRRLYEQRGIALR